MMKSNADKNIFECFNEKLIFTYQLPWLSSIVYDVALNVPATCMCVISFYIVRLRKPVTIKENPLLFT